MTTSQRIFGRQLRRLLLVPLIVSLLIAVVLELQLRRVTAAKDWVDHTDVVLSQARLLLRTMIDQETGVRGFLLTGREQFLDPYHQGDSVLPGLFDQLRTQIADNQQQQLRLESVKGAYTRWHEYAENAVARGKNDVSIKSSDFNLRGKELMDEVRQRQQEFADEEERLKVMRTEASSKSDGTLKWTLLGLMVVLAATLLNETRTNLHAIDAEYSTVLNNLQLQAAALSESRERLRVTLRSIGDAVIVTDADGTVNFVNPVAEKLTQMSSESAVGKHLDEVFRILNEETKLKAESPFSKVMRLGTVVGLANHTALVRPDATEISIDDSGAPIRDDAGKILGVVLVFRDITEQKEILTILRTNEKLAAAGRLSASIAHEIHNPLETARNLFFMVKKNVGKDSLSLIELAEQELSRVVQITKNMLSLYRESKQVTPTKLSEVLESVVMLLQRRIRDSGVGFSTSLQTSAFISAFPAEMRQVVSNLITNAIDAAEPDGKVEVVIEDSTMKDGATAVSLLVRDSGSGVSQENLPKLFRPFFTTKGENGTGLGLWITQGIVSKHGGYIEVESETTGANRGTTFRVMFPKLS
jgi:PAS domain S-box-containing protein